MGKPIVSGSKRKHGFDWRWRTRKAAAAAGHHRAE